MEFCTLASGSKGNSTYIKLNEIEILIDCGITCSSLLNLLSNKNINIMNIQYLFITHTHSDHIKGLEVLLKKYDIVIISTELILNELREKMNIKRSIVIPESMILKNISITKIQASHDSVDCIGFMFEENDKSLVYITDTGYINSKYHKLISNKEVYLIESNYDCDLLLNGSYPYHLKSRILSDVGHLSNKDCARYLKKILGKKTKYVGLLHLSEENNDFDIAFNNISKMLEEINLTPNLFIAKQKEAGELISL